MRLLNYLQIVLVLFFSTTIFGQFKVANPTDLTQQNKNLNNSIYQFVVFDINLKPFDFAKLKGKKIMIVNTASKCGNTPQYEQLELLYKKYQSKGFIIVGFPANNFWHQEPGTNAEIAEFCKSKYGVTFPMMEKISVKGSDMHRIYQFLTQKKLNGVMDSEVEWNFQKYLINRNGILEKVINNRTSPLDPEIIKWIEN